MRPPRIALVAALAASGAGCADDPRAALESLAFDTVATIGVLDGDSALVFGRVRDLEVDGEGRIYLLDGAVPAIRLLDAEGRPLGSVTARGGGPGELAGPTALALAADGELRVMDPRNGRIEAFRASDGGLTHVRSIPTEVAGGGLCRIADGWYTQRITGDASLHRLDDDGAAVTAFAPPIDISRFVGGAPGPMIVATFASGPMACTPEPEVVLALATALPTVRAFAPDGSALWEVELADYVPLQVETTGGMGVRSRPAEGTGSHVALGIEPWSAGVVLVQLEVRRGEAPGEAAEIDSRFLSLETGVELHRTRALPRVAAVRDDHVYAVRTDPFPQIVVLRRR